jgi:transposase
VITVPAGVKIYLACGITDMRRGFDGLSIMAPFLPFAAAEGAS